LRASFALEEAMGKVAKSEYAAALADLKKVTALSGEEFLESTILLAHLYYILGRNRDAFESFDKARQQIEQHKKLSHENRDYLLLYCISHYKDNFDNSPFLGMTLPSLPDFKLVNRRYLREFPMKPAA
jgi:tetratricopeptide (TPR) repeat protein